MTRTTTYHCDGFRPVKLGEYATYGDTRVQIRSIDDAAKVFGTRLARRRYGKRAYCRHICESCHLRYWRLFEFDAFVGAPDGTGLKGRNVKLSITYVIRQG